MEGGENVALLSRKELRKQKLTEYLVTKGRFKDSKSSSRCGDSVPRKPLLSKAMNGSGKENKTLADRLGHGQTKTLSQFSLKPPRSVLGATTTTTTTTTTQQQDNNKVNVKNGTQTVWPGTHLKRPANPSTQPRLKLALKKNDAVLQRATSLSSNRSNTRVTSSGWKSSKSDSTAAPVSTSRFCSGSQSAWACSMSSASSRINLGCLVKTRTGLVPAVTQSLHVPSRSQPRDSAPKTTVARAAAADKSSHKTTSAPDAVDRRPAAAQRSLPTSASSKAARDKGVSSTAAAGDRKTKAPLKPSTRPSLLPPKSQISNGLKSTCRTYSCTLDRAKVTARGTTSSQSDSRPTGSSIRQTMHCEGNDGIQQLNASSRLSNQVAASSCRGVRRSAPAAAAAAAAAATAVRGKSSIHTHTKRGQSSVNGKPPQVGLRRAVSSVTVPQPPRITSHTRRATVTMATKTPAAKTPAKAAPQTEGAKVTAAQEERMKKLKEWRESRGISYKRPPMQVKAQVKPPSGKDEVDSLISTLDRALSDCVKLLEEGSPAEEVRPILLRLPPVSRKFTKFWICQARLMEREGNLDVLPMFKEAVSVVLEPLDELRMVVFEILKKKEELQVSTPDRAEEQSPGGRSSVETFTSLLMTPKPITELVGGEKGDSSVIKYRVTTTPGRPPRQQQEPRRFNGREIRFLTPVRRSSRIHGAAVPYPEPLRDHDLCVSSYKELLRGSGGTAEDTPLYIYAGNEALGDDVSVQLVSLPPAESVNHAAPGRGCGGGDSVRRDDDLLLRENRPTSSTHSVLP